MWVEYILLLCSNIQYQKYTSDNSNSCWKYCYTYRLYL